MADSHKKCCRCNLRLSWWQLAKAEGYEAVCCECLSYAEKIQIDQSRNLEVLMRLDAPDASDLS